MARVGNDYGYTGLWLSHSVNRLKLSLLLDFLRPLFRVPLSSTPVMAPVKGTCYCGEIEFTIDDDAAFQLGG